MSHADDKTIERELASLFERRLGGLMVVRLELTDLLDRFKREEHALATSLRAILQLRDKECSNFEARIERSEAYARRLEDELLKLGQPLPGQGYARPAASLGGCPPTPTGGDVESVADVGGRPAGLLELPASPPGNEGLYHAGGPASTATTGAVSGRASDEGLRGFGGGGQQPSATSQPRPPGPSAPAAIARLVLAKAPACAVPDFATGHTAPAGWFARPSAGGGGARAARPPGHAAPGGGYAQPQYRAGACGRHPTAEEQAAAHQLAQRLASERAGFGLGAGGTGAEAWRRPAMLSEPTLEEHPSEMRRQGGARLPSPGGAGAGRGLSHTIKPASDRVSGVADPRRPPINPEVVTAEGIPFTFCHE